ncbi:MAG: hypothetical protein JWM61_3312 [Micrococcaceae bacterium]|jgi:hypothetical protein|nr:hypothetical protein [Micrococcaceae bacterium]
MELLIVLGVPAVIGVVALGAPPAWLEWKRKHTNVRLVSARIDHHWEAIDETLEHRFLLGGELVIINAGQHRVSHVTVQEPAQLTAIEIKRLGPGERYTLHLPAPLVAHLDTEPTIVLHLQDRKHRFWSWSPTDDELEPIPTPITPLARLVQASADKWPESWHEDFAQLPEPVQRILWGSLPTNT